MKYRHYAIYRVAVGPLVGRGWERERPTLPKLYGEETRPQVLAFFRLMRFFYIRKPQ